MRMMHLSVFDMFIFLASLSLKTENIELWHSLMKVLATINVIRGKRLPVSLRTRFKSPEFGDLFLVVAQWPYY